MSVCRVKYHNIHLCRYKRITPFKHICSDSKCRTAKQSALRILCGIRILYLLFNILYCNKSLKVAVFINYRKLFHSGLCQNFLGFLQGSALKCRNQMFLSHTLRYLLCIIFLKLQVSVGNDTYQFLSFSYRNS